MNTEPAQHDETNAPSDTRVGDAGQTGTEVETRSTHSESPAHTAGGDASTNALGRIFPWLAVAAALGSLIGDASKLLPKPLEPAAPALGALVLIILAARIRGRLLMAAIVPAALLLSAAIFGAMNVHPIDTWRCERALQVAQRDLTAQPAPLPPGAIVQQLQQDDATQACEAASAVDRARRHVLLARGLHAMGSTTKAREELELAQKATPPQNQDLTREIEALRSGLCGRILDVASKSIDDAKYEEAIAKLQYPATQDNCTAFGGVDDSRRRRLFALALWKTGQYSRARAEAEEAIKRAPPEDHKALADAHQTLGNIFNELQDWSQARREFDSAIHFGNRSPTLLVDYSISLRHLNVRAAEFLHEAADAAAKGSDLRSKKVRASALRQLAIEDSASLCSGAVNFFKEASDTLSDAPEAADLRTQCYDDWTFGGIRCANSAFPLGATLKEAYAIGDAWLARAPATHDRERVAVNRATRYSEAYRNLAARENKAGNTNARDNAINTAARIVDAVQSTVAAMQGNESLRLRWWLERLSVYHVKNDNEQVQASLNGADALSLQLPPGQALALANYHQVAGILRNDKLQLLKAYSVYFGMEVGPESDLEIVAAELSRMGIKNLPRSRRPLIVKQQN